MKILITGGNSAVALKLLKAFKEHEVVLADYGDVPSFTSKTYNLISLGVKNEDILAHTLLNNCLDEGVAAILPIHTFEVEALAKADVLFKEFDITLLLPSVFELNKYFLPTLSKKTDHWAIFINGDLIYSTLTDEKIVELGKNNKLNGAYYLTADKEFYLLTI